MEKMSKLLCGAYSIPFMILLFAVALLTAAPVCADDSDEGMREESTITTGSGKLYRTTVKRHTTGELSSEDLHQASLLGSRVASHLNEAVLHLTDADEDAAKPELEKAQELCSIIRDLLPVTTVTTVVKNADGREMYRDTDKVQDDRIPLYSGMIAMKVVEPLVDAQEEKAALKGLRLAEADVIHTSVLMDLGYVERKLKRALALLGKPEEALAELERAQTEGIELSVNREDNPLVNVQEALRLAERMVEEERFEAAKDNLQLAQMHLETYRAVLGQDAAEKVKNLQDRITEVSGKLNMKKTAGKIREFWEEVVSWFREEPGQARVTEDTATEEKKE